MTNGDLDSKMGMCAVLSNGQTIIYLEAGDSKHWIEPCFIQSYKDSKVGFMPLQVFGESYLAEPVNPQHILCSYVPESQIEEAYKNFLRNYFLDSRTQRN